MSRKNFEDRFDQVMAERDPETRRAMTRRLRAEAWDMLSEAEQDRVRRSGLDFTKLRGALRQID